MYFAMILFLMGIFPVASVVTEYAFLRSNMDLLMLVGKWFVFWAVGCRLLIAGVRQISNPAFTAQSIFNVTDKGAFHLVRELGYWNLIIGALAIASLWTPSWVMPLAIAGGAYYGLAGIGHALKSGRNATENAAMVSDLFICVVLTVFVVMSGLRSFNAPGN